MGIPSIRTSTLPSWPQSPRTPGATAPCTSTPNWKPGTSRSRSIRSRAPLSRISSRRSTVRTAGASRSRWARSDATLTGVSSRSASERSAKSEKSSGISEASGFDAVTGAAAGEDSLVDGLGAVTASEDASAAGAVGPETASAPSMATAGAASAKIPISEAIRTGQDLRDMTSDRSGWGGNAECGMRRILAPRTREFKSPSLREPAIASPEASRRLGVQLGRQTAGRPRVKSNSSALFKHPRGSRGRRQIAPDGDKSMMAQQHGVRTTGAGKCLRDHRGQPVIARFDPRKRCHRAEQRRLGMNAGQPVGGRRPGQAGRCVAMDHRADLGPKPIDRRVNPPLARRRGTRRPYSAVRPKMRPVGRGQAVLGAAGGGDAEPVRVAKRNVAAAFAEQSFGDQRRDNSGGKRKVSGHADWCPRQESNLRPTA